MVNKWLLLFIFTNFWFISIIYHRSILFELFVVFIFMFFVQVSYTIISLIWRIIRTMILFIGIIFVIYLMSKICRCFFQTIYFYTSYSNLFCPIPKVDCIFNRFSSNNRSIWVFLSFILASNTKIILCYTC